MTTVNAATSAGTPGLPAIASVARPEPAETRNPSPCPWYPPSVLMIRARPVAARASRTALIVASVPELTNRTISTKGTAAATRSARSPSGPEANDPAHLEEGQGSGDALRQAHLERRRRSERGPPPQRSRQRPPHERRSVPEEMRTVGLDVGDVGLSVHIAEPRSPPRLDEERLSSDRSEGPHGRRHASRHQFLRALEQRGGAFVLHCRRSKILQPPSFSHRAASRA